MVEFPMKVSAIILTYNRAHMVAEAIDSVLNQTFRDFELIVVDNYSSDNTESVVKSYADKRIRYFKHQNNGFIGVNRNYGIKKSRGEYIAFLDDDDLWLPEKLEKQVELLDSNKELGLVYSDIYLIDSNGNLREHTYFYRIKPFRGEVFNELLQGNFIPLSTVVIRQGVLDEVGGFNLRFIIAQDYDLWLRIAEHYSIDYAEAPLAKYRVHGESGLKNTALSYQEVVQIKEHWLNKKPELKRELGSLFRLRRGLQCCLLASYYVCKYRNRKAIKDFINLLKYFLLPKRGTHKDILL